MKHLLILALAVILCLPAAACKKEDEEYGIEQFKYDREHDPDLKALYDRRQAAAERRGRFNESEFKAYAQDYIRQLLAETYPERDAETAEISIDKDDFTEDELAPLDGDTEKAFQMLRDGNWGIFYDYPENDDFITEEELQLFLEKLNDLGFTAYVSTRVNSPYFIENGEITQDMSWFEGV